MKDEYGREIVTPEFDLSKVYEVELTINAKVKLTQDLLNGIADQYPDLWEKGKNDPEELAKAAVYALINPHVGRAYKQDYWDGVVETLHGIVLEASLD